MAWYFRSRFFSGRDFFVVVAVGFFILQTANDKIGCEWCSCSPRHHPFVSFRISVYWTRHVFHNTELGGDTRG